MAIKAMVHLNSNLLCAVDIETTGPRPGYHDIWQICVLPLDHDMMPYKGLLPFYTDLKPEHPDRAEKKYITQDQLAKAVLRGIAPDRVADMLQSWFEKIGLAPDKRLHPLSCDWPSHYAFLLHWLGFYQTEMIFHKWFRDLTATACYSNDSAFHAVEQLPYPKCHFRYICSCLKVLNDSPDDAMSDCIAMAECHRRMLKKLF